MRFASGLFLLLALILFVSDEVRSAAGGNTAGWTKLRDVVADLARQFPGWDPMAWLSGLDGTQARGWIDTLLAQPAWALPAVLGALILVLALPRWALGLPRWSRANTDTGTGAASDQRTVPAAPATSDDPMVEALRAAARAADVTHAHSQVQRQGPGAAGPRQPTSGSAIAAQPARAAQTGRTPAQAPSQATGLTLPSTRDREFLPAALEILATPPSPVATSLLLTICAAFLATIAWSYFGWLDIHAVAQGKVQPSGRSKVIQPLEPGKVVAIHVENGSRINAGDVMLELDPTETAADREAQARDLEASSAEAERRRAGVAAVASGSMQPAPISFRNYVTMPVRSREESVLAADLGQLRSQIASLRSQLEEKVATKNRLNASIAARQKLLALAKERVGMRETLDAKGSGSRALIIEALQQYEQQMTQDASERGQVLESDAAVVSLERKIEEARTQFMADQTQKLAEAERKRDRLEQELLKAQSKNERTQLRAPITGTVQQLAVTSIGQVVTSGQSLATIVPVDGQLEVEAMIVNRDIGFVKAGQAAVVKVEAFPFTRYGVINAKVVKISRDAVDERDAPNMSDAATAAKSQQAAQQAPSSRTQGLVYPATLQLDQRWMQIDGENVNLSPGMAVTVEIKTGERRAIDFVLSPLREMQSRAARER